MELLFTGDNMITGDLVATIDGDKIGVLISIKPLSGIVENAYWVLWSNGSILWSTKSRLEIVNETG